jgi:hypothetical protein
MTETQNKYNIRIEGNTVDWPAIVTESNAAHHLDTTAAALSALLDEIEADWIDQRITEVLLNDGKIWPEEVERIRRDVTALMAPYRARLAALVEG